MQQEELEELEEEKEENSVTFLPMIRQSAALGPAMTAPALAAPAPIEAPSETPSTAALPPSATAPASSLTNDWLQYSDQDGRAYFYNKATEQTTWKLPADVAPVASTPPVASVPNAEALEVGWVSGLSHRLSQGLMPWTDATNQEVRNSRVDIQKEENLGADSASEDLLRI